jgi:4-carboxymuconolactone decarboxylase
MMLGNDENNEYSIANVQFSPSARTNWHTHPKGQVLLVLAGNGYYQEEGKPVQKLSKGDVVNIPPHVNHWHGAQPNSDFVHIAITNYKDGQNVEWGEPVTDEQYKSVEK